MSACVEGTTCVSGYTEMAVCPHVEIRDQPLVPQELSTVLKFIFVSVCVCDVGI